MTVAAKELRRRYPDIAYAIEETVDDWWDDRVMAAVLPKVEAAIAEALEQAAQAVEAEREAHYREYGDEVPGPRGVGIGLDRAARIVRDLKPGGDDDA